MKFPIVRLSANSYPELPSQIRRYLTINSYKIPQLWDRDKLRNVITGHFYNQTQSDWAVLASKRDISTILIFKSGSTKNIERLVPKSDKVFFQGIGGGKVGYSRYIVPVGKVEMEFYQKEFHGPELPVVVDHEGIADCFDEKSSIIYYYYKGKWIELQGAD